MDTSEYMPMFLAEAREHLQELNLAVVRVEDVPDDHATIDQIFRIAHSLKGMSATMGFAAVASLTHEMEDVFELLRQRAAGLTREAVDTLLACLDALEIAMESIETTGAEGLDPAMLTVRLRGLVRGRSSEQELARAGGRVEPNLLAAAEAGLRVIHVEVTLAEEVLMPSVRAYMVLAALGDHGEVIGAAPTPDCVEQFEGGLVEVWLACDHEDEAVEATARAVSDVVSVVVEEVALPEVTEDVPEPGGEPEPGGKPEPGGEPAPGYEPELAEVAEVTDVAQTANVVEVAEVAEVAESSRAATATPAHKPATGRTVRVDAERLDALMHAMGELVIHRTAVEAIADTLGAADLHRAMQELTRSSQELQAMVMQVRMIPVDIVFLRLPRLVRDLSTKLGKDVALSLIGSETELDRTVVDALGDPLVHLVRNSLDHGLESAAEREAAGKPPQATLEIAARHAGGSVVIEVNDDGRGIDAGAIARKAAGSGLIDPATIGEIDVAAAIELLFTPGFTTAAVTSDISGRGVGLDAVRARIRELGGEVSLQSVPGEGTSAQIRLPLTLAIVAGLLVEVGSDPYAIPLDRIERTLSLDEHPVRSVLGAPQLLLDDGVVPVLASSRVFGRGGARAQAFAVVVRTRAGRIALAVDDLVGQRELVTRPLPSIVAGGEPVSGAAALPDGRIALIVDCDALGSAAADSPAPPPAPAPAIAAAA